MRWIGTTWKKWGKGVTYSPRPGEEQNHEAHRNTDTTKRKFKKRRKKGLREEECKTEGHSKRNGALDAGLQGEHFMTRNGMGQG